MGGWVTGNEKVCQGVIEKTMCMKVDVIGRCLNAFPCVTSKESVNVLGYMIRFVRKYNSSIDV